MKFGEVIEGLKDGKCYQRSGWNEKGMFICKQVPCEYAGLVIEKFQSLPNNAKKSIPSKEIPKISSWVPSSSDIFAEDWEEINKEDDNIMESFIKRMTVELGELGIKLNKLNDFIKSDKFQELTAENKELLLIQRDAMDIYYRTLHKRILLNA